MVSINTLAATVKHACLYVACPVHAFSTDRYQCNRAAIRAHWPDALILEPKHLYTGNADWLARWPSTLAFVTEVVFFTDDHGYYGEGVYKELADARKRGLPVWYLADDGVFHDDTLVRHGVGYLDSPGKAWRAALPSYPERPAEAATPRGVKAVPLSVAPLRREPRDAAPSPVRDDPRRGPDASLLVAAFHSADGQRHEGVRVRQGNAATMRAYQEAVARALAGDDSGLPGFQRAMVYDTRARLYYLLTDGDAIRATGAAVSLAPTSALQRKGC